MKPAIVLIAMMSLAAAILALTHALTGPTIADNRERHRNERLDGLVPTSDPAILCRTGVTLLEHQVRGYGGAMTVVAAYRGDQLLGIRVVEHAETPGFDDILDPSDWLGSFGHVQMADVDAVSGATITSRAVLDAVATLGRRATDNEPEC